jgi:LemA protein
MATIGIIAVVAILVILLLWGISKQNQLVKADERCNNALKQINVQQMSRYDALKALIKLTREYADYEGSTLQKVVEARRITSSASPTVEQVRENESALQAIQAGVIAVAEQYPQLKANENYLKAMDDIKAYEENVRLSRMTFNDTVTRFNNEVRMFPGSIVASLLHFAKREYLADDDSTSEYPDF